MTTYIYRVTEFFSDLKGNSFDCSEEFKDKNLLKAKQDAWMYYCQRHEGILQKGEFFGAKFEKYSDFKHGENSIYSINIALVEMFEGEEFEYFIAGEDQQTSLAAIQHEAIVLGSWHGDDD